MKPIEIISQDLFDKIRSRFTNLEMGDKTGAVTIDPSQARFFDFDYVQEEINLGRVSISLNELGSLKVYYSQGITENQDDTATRNWYNFLKEMRFFAMRRLLRFDTRDITKSNLDRNDFQYLAAKAPKQESPIAENINSVKEIGYASELDDSNYSVDKLLKIGKVIGSIENHDVMMVSGGAEKVYFLVVDGEITALLGFKNGHLKNVKNFTKTPGVVRALIGYLIHKAGKKITIIADEDLTPDGIKCLIHLIKSPRGLTIQDQKGKPVDAMVLKKEWLEAKKSGTPGPTGIVISENSVFGKKLRENEQRYQSSSLLMPVNLYEIPRKKDPSNQLLKRNNMKNIQESRWSQKSSRKTSRAVRGATEVIVRHANPVEGTYPGARSQRNNIKAIFIQNRDGERFKYPFIHPAGAFAMAQHVDHGGVPHDPAGKAIVRMSEQIAQLQEFQRKVRPASLHDDAMGITERAMGKLQELKSCMANLSKRKYYESWLSEFNEKEEPVLGELDAVTMETYKQKFTQTSFNEELSELFPLIHSIMQEANTVELEEYVSKDIDSDEIKNESIPKNDFTQFEEWAEAVEQGKLTDDQIQNLKTAMADLETAGQKLELGPLGQTAWEFFSSFGLEDSDLEDKLQSMADIDPETDPVQVLQVWAKDNYPELLVALGMSGTVAPQEPAPQEPAPQEPAPQEPVAENMDSKSIMREVARVVGSFYNRDNPNVGPFRSEESVALDVEKQISEKFGEQHGSHARAIAEKFMEKLTQKWAQKHGQGAAEGLGKAIKRGLQGWGGVEDDPKTLVKRNKEHDIETAKMLRKGLDNAPPHSPAGLQKRVLDRKLKGVQEGMGDIVKGIKRTLKGKEHPDVVAAKHAGRAMGHYNQGDIKAGDKESQRYVKTRDMHLKAKGLAEGPEQDLVQIEYWKQDSIEAGRWVKTMPIPRKTAEELLYTHPGAFARGEIVDVEQGVAEGGGMPSSVIDAKRRLANMSPPEFAKKYASKSPEELMAMARRHGYGEGSKYYVDKRSKGQQGGVAEGALDEIDFSSGLGDLSISPEQIIDNSSIDGTIGSRKVHLYKVGKNKIYFFIDNKKIDALVYLVHDRVVAMKNFSDNSGLIYNLFQYIINIKGQKLKLTPIDKLTPDGIKWVIGQIRRADGFNISDANGNKIDPKDIYDEWENARVSGNPGPTEIVISESKNGKKIRENETRILPMDVFGATLKSTNDQYLDRTNMKNIIESDSDHRKGVAEADSKPGWMLRKMAREPKGSPGRTAFDKIADRQAAMAALKLPSDHKKVNAKIQASKDSVDEAYDPHDEADVWYKVNDEGRMTKSHIIHADIPKARRQGWSETTDQALRKAGIMRSKFDPKKYVQNVGGKWVQVHPYGQKDVNEGWKNKLAGAAMVGLGALGANDVSARVGAGDHNDPGINRLTGKPNFTQQTGTDSSNKHQSPQGYSKEYLLKAADPNRTGRFLISVEKAQELLKQKNEEISEELNSILKLSGMNK